MHVLPWPIYIYIISLLHKKSRKIFSEENDGCFTGLVLGGGGLGWGGTSFFYGHVGIRLGVRNFTNCSTYVGKSGLGVRFFLKIFTIWLDEDGCSISILFKSTMRGEPLAIFFPIARFWSSEFNGGSPNV